MSLLDEVVFRRATEADLPAINTIEQTAHYQPWTQEQLASCFRSKYFIGVLTLHHRVIAYGVMNIVLGESELLTLSVSTDYQQKGLGYKLLHSLFHEVMKEGVYCCFLEVRPSNKSAIKLYRKLGFYQVGLRKDYYKTREGREDGLVLCCDLG